MLRVLTKVLLREAYKLMWSLSDILSFKKFRHIDST
jgi:hypothetical protein